MRWLAALALLAAAPAAAQEPVRLGVLTDMSADSTGTGSVLAARMAVEDFGGTVLGRPLEVLAADHGGKPDTGASIARKWMAEQDVRAIIDVPVSSIGFAIQALTREKDRIFLNSSSGSSDLTGKACSPNAVAWTYDTYAMANVTAEALVPRGDTSWYFITADYAFGKALEADGAAAVKRSGGTLAGSTLNPFGTADFSAYLLQAQASQAKVVALAQAVGDTATAVKQAEEFGLAAGGQKIVGLLVDVVDLHSIGLRTAQGMVLTIGFYWDRTDASRAWSRRFLARQGRMPTQFQAGVYSEVTHYLRAVAAAGTLQTGAVMASMRAMPVHDFFAEDGVLRPDGRMVHDMYVMQVKTPAESTGEWDLLKPIATVPGDRAFRPMADGGCDLVR